MAHCYKPEHWVHQILAPSLCRDSSAYALILVPRSKSPWAACHSLACWNLSRPAQHACNLHVHARTPAMSTDGTRRAMWQYVVKPSRTRLSGFGWHRDRDWCCGPEVDYSPYLSVWIALDDMHAGSHPLHAALTHWCAAGTMYLPWLCLLLSTSGPPATWQRCIPGHLQETVRWSCEAAPHLTARTTCCWRWLLAQRCARLQDLERPESAVLPSITVALQCSPLHAFGLQPSGNNPSCITHVFRVAQVILSDGVLHSSQANVSLRSRRAWMPQFSCRPIRWQATCAPVALAIPIGPSDQEPDTVHCVTP